MRKILMFVETFAVIFVLAACGNGVQKKTYEKYSAAEVEQAGQKPYEKDFNVCGNVCSYLCVGCLR